MSACMALWTRAGQPALIPPGGSPLRSDTWLKLSDLLERIKAEHLPDSWHKLLVLDCNRILVNWEHRRLGQRVCRSIA